MSIIEKLPTVESDEQLLAAAAALIQNHDEEASIRKSLAEAEQELTIANERLVSVSAQAVRGQIDGESRGAVLEAKQAVSAAEAHQLAHLHALTAIAKERPALEAAVEAARHTAEVRVAGELLAIEKRLVGELVAGLMAIAPVEDELEAVQAHMRRAFPEYHANKEARRAMLPKSVELPSFEAVKSGNIANFFKHLVELGLIETKEEAN